MSYLIRKIKHFLTANTRHGTHSPFVYELADELIYNKHVKRSSSLIQDIQDYYNTKGIDPSSFVVTDFLEYKPDDLLKLQNDYFMVFVKNIHLNQSLVYWECMQKSEGFIVLIDLFEFGIICKRKEQPKENFRLRYPYQYYCR
ncbi:hypothetical protein [Sphingobacterium bovistauri]|uniref:hypothetical protein n=1 Tax=Sphingobacterium bovistauri TaxID=2781959 RepID=UPI001CE1365C|nr:hypothetical protein [Sphingobacterium bovistauri]